MNPWRSSRRIDDWVNAVARKFPPFRAFEMYNPGIDKFEPERLEELETARRLIRAYFNVEWQGVEHVPRTGGALLVGNHGRTGLDSFVFAGLSPDVFGRPIRALAERNLFRLPGFKTWVATLGAIPGERRSAVRLLKEGNLVLVYPGGSREVLKRDDQVYQLLWGDRTGFIHVALEAGVPILPFAGIGVEEMFYKLPAWEALEKSRLNDLLEAVTGHRLNELPAPLVGIGKSPFPAPVKLTFRFGEPFSTANLSAQDPEQMLEFQRRVRDRVARLVADGLADRDLERSQAMR